jgi:uncharacterized RDD family membrane protein YckC
MIKINSENISINRTLALAFDWVLGGIICSLPEVLVFCMNSNNDQYLTNFYNLLTIGCSKDNIIFLLIISIILTFGYYVVIPWKIFPGQTLGKHLMHLKIVYLNGKKLRLKDYIIREFLILNLIEGCATYTSNYFRVLITICSGINVDNYFGIIWNILTFISILMLLINSRHLCIHDYLTCSTVIFSREKGVVNAEQ